MNAIKRMSTQAKKKIITKELISETDGNDTEDDDKNKRISLKISAPENVAHKVNVTSDLEWNGEDPFNLFQLTDKLGEGSFGSVWKVVTKEQGSRETALAIKQITLNEETDIEDIENEINILKQCKSPFIVSYYGVFRLGTIMWILMDYCGLGSVADIIEVNGKPFDEKVSAWVMQCALHGLSYLHRMRIVHRDVKGGNILVQEDGNIKLADFGVSEKLEKVIGEVAGTPLWMAPEVAKRGEPYNHKADIWSLGITLIEIIDGQPPLSDLNAYRVMLAIQKNDPPTVKNPKNMSSNFLDFLGQCLVKDYNIRSDTQDLLKHPYVLYAKQGDLKHIIEKTLKNQKKHKRDKAAYIEHSPITSEKRPKGENVETSEVPSTPGRPVVLDVEQESSRASILQHNSPPASGPLLAGSPLPTSVPNTPLWAQPGYVPTENNNNSNKNNSTSTIEPLTTPNGGGADVNQPTEEKKPLLTRRPEQADDDTCCSTCSCTIL